MNAVEAKMKTIVPVSDVPKIRYDQKRRVESARLGESC